MADCKGEIIEGKITLVHISLNLYVCGHVFTTYVLYIFLLDIQQMLFGLGDCPKPLLSTAEVLEETLVAQTKSLLSQAKCVSNRRGAVHIDYQDILFLLRNDKWKLQRLINYFSKFRIIFIMKHLSILKYYHLTLCDECRILKV